MKFSYQIAAVISAIVISSPFALDVSTVTARSPQSILTSRQMALVSSTRGRSAITVELATTEQSRGTGLNGRLALAEHAGMLFIFDSDQKWTFWMRDTFIPLSIAFIDAYGNIVDIQDIQPLDETKHARLDPSEWLWK